MDTHDVYRGRSADALRGCPPGALVIAISSDGLFTLSELRDIADGISDARLEIVDSPQGHDGFLLEFAQINELVLTHLRQRLPEIYAAAPLLSPADAQSANAQGDSFKPARPSLFGEAEAVDISRW